MNSAIRTAAGKPKGLLGMLALVLLLELFVARASPRFATQSAYDWKLGSRAASTAAPRCDILCFGDSMIKFGVQPRILQDVLGRPVYNLAVFAGPPQASYFLLQQALNAGAKPSSVIVDFQPEFLAADQLEIHPREFPELGTLRDCLELAWNARNPHFFGEMATSWILPSVRNRLDLRAAILTSLGGQSNPLGLENQALKRNRRQNRGATVFAARPNDDGNLSDQRYASIFNSPWKCTRLNGLYVKRFLTLAESRGIRVFWLLPPVRPDVQALRDAVGQTASYGRFIERAQARFANLIIVDGRRSGYDPTAFVDVVHLHETGANALSQDLANLIRPTLAGASDQPRRLILPSYHPEAARVVALENWDESRQVQIATQTRKH